MAPNLQRNASLRLSREGRSVAMIAKYAIAYVATLVIFLAIDAVWLTIMAARLYKPTLGDILLPNFLVAPAAVFLRRLHRRHPDLRHGAGLRQRAMDHGADLRRAVRLLLLRRLRLHQLVDAAQLERHHHHRRRDLGHGADRDLRRAGLRHRPGDRARVEDLTSGEHSRRSDDVAFDRPSDVVPSPMRPLSASGETV